MRQARLRDRAAAAGTALGLQVIFAAGFLHTVMVAAPPARRAVELTLLLPRLASVPAAAPRTRLRTGSPVPTEAPRQDAPAPQTITPEAMAALRAFGQALNDCAPEKYNSLPPDRRAHCPRPDDGVAVQDAPNLMGAPSHVKDGARWQAELARKQSPFALPCFGGTDLLCLIETVSNGSITDPHTWPVYETKRYPPEDLYKLEQAYDAWHQSHPQ